ncbi:hypothetical protein V8C35DRAFT_311233, partial [Trichoderma chlorosporum]
MAWGKKKNMGKMVRLSQRDGAITPCPTSTSLQAEIVAPRTLSRLGRYNEWRFASQRKKKRKGKKGLVYVVGSLPVTFVLVLHTHTPPPSLSLSFFSLIPGVGKDLGGLCFVYRTRVQADGSVPFVDCWTDGTVYYGIGLRRGGSEMLMSKCDNRQYR